MKMITKLGSLVLVVAALSLSVPTVFAHHSGVEFDADKIVEITGTVKEFQFKNPHSWVQVMVPGVAGTKGETEWSLEWGSPNTLGRQGIRPTTFPVGGKITVRLNPMKNGAPGGMFIGAKFADGKTVGTWN